MPAMKRDTWGFSTRAIHAEPPATSVVSRPVAWPLHQTASFEFDSSEDLGHAIFHPEDSYTYSRLSNPTTAILETTLAGLEGAEAGLAFASGMAAIHTTLIHLLSPGDHVVAPSALYGGSFQLLRHILPRFGIEATFVDHHDLSAWRKAVRPSTKVIYAETIGNPTLFVPDLAALSEIARGAGAKVVVDSTFATPRIFRPIEAGVDVVIHSASKFLGGHGDLVAGVVAGKKDVVDGLRHTATETGGAIAPFVSWLILRGIATLALRVDRVSASAMLVARHLDRHPKVTRVFYPGLDSDPCHAVAKRQFGDRFGGVLAFDVGAREAGRHLTDRLELIKRAGSLGDVRSLIIQPSSTTHRQLDREELARAHISEGFIRLAIGLEEPADLIADLDRALSEI
jgi:methionine-gamma-lyase